MNEMMIGAACAKCCPPHAIAALAAAALIGFAGGFFVGKRRNGATATKKPSAPQRKQPQQRREPRSAESRQPIPAGSVEIYVGNLSYDLTEDSLHKMFSEFGTIGSARIVTNKFNNKSKGFGFVVMPNRPEAEAAIAALNDKDVMGRKMRVNEAKNTIKEEE